MCISNMLLNFIVASESFMVSTTPYTISELDQNNLRNNKIELDGYLARYIGKSVSLFQPIEAIKEANSLTISTYSTLGFLDIAIHDFDGNSLFHKNMNISARDVLTIDTSGWKTGMYKIRFINLQNEIMHGEFEIE